MKVSSLGNFSAAQKQTTETSEGNKDARPAASAESQGTTTEEAQTSPIPPVNQAAELSGEAGNTTAPESSSGAEVDPSLAHSRGRELARTHQAETTL